MGANLLTGANRGKPELHQGVVLQFISLWAINVFQAYTGKGGGEKSSSQLSCPCTYVYFASNFALGYLACDVTWHGVHGLLLYVCMLLTHLYSTGTCMLCYSWLSFQLFDVGLHSPTQLIIVSTVMPQWMVNMTQNLVVFRHQVEQWKSWYLSRLLHQVKHASFNSASSMSCRQLMPARYITKVVI